MIDRDKMTPGEWEAVAWKERGYEGVSLKGNTADRSIVVRELGDSGTFSERERSHAMADLQAIADLHNAWLVMLETGWGVFQNVAGRWQAAIRDNRLLRELREKDWPDPATAILEAWRWWKEQEKKER